MFSPRQWLIAVALPAATVLAAACGPTSADRTDYGHQATGAATPFEAFTVHSLGE